MDQRQIEDQEVQAPQVAQEDAPKDLVGPVDDQEYPEDLKDALEDPGGLEALLVDREVHNLF